MKRLCDGGCRREARTEWVRPGDDPWWLCAIHTFASRAMLTAQGWTDFNQLDEHADAPRLTLTGGMDAAYETD